MYKFYVGRLEDATDFYVKIIEKAIVESGGEVRYIEHSSEIGRDDTVVTISVLYFLYAFLRRPKRTINWYQGVSPEEIIMFIRGNKCYRVLKKWLYTLGEFIALRRCDLNLFVSQAMLQHYSKKYGYDKSNYHIMPCFNERMQPKSFSDEKYRKPTFLYSGSALAWQCVPETVRLFKEIKSMLPDATLTIFSKDQEEMRRILLANDVQAEVRYVPYQQMSREIKNFKYGFLVRQDNVVNNVATPTKMSSYLANGIIPIFTDVIGDFKGILGNLKYCVPIGVDNSGIEKVFEIENSIVKGNDVLDDYKKVFDTYYSVELHVAALSQKVMEIG